MVVTQNGVPGPSVLQPAEMGVEVAVVRAPIPLQVPEGRTAQNLDLRRKLVNVTVADAQVCPGL